MICPICSQDTAVTLRDLLAMETNDSPLLNQIHPGERPSNLGGLFLGGGVGLVLFAIVIGNMNEFRRAFWDWSASRIGVLGLLILGILGLMGVLLALHGLKTLSNRSGRLALWERKQRFYESGLCCPRCQKSWLPGLEDRPIEL